MIQSKLLTVAVLFVSCICADQSLAQSDLTTDPYTVYVAKEGEYARCGPSTGFYKTDPLRRRQPLKVYVETKEGWLGVKPLDNSFCWVPADAVELNEADDTGAIIEDGTAVWIGTHLEVEPKHRWQVKLATGETITVISKRKRQGPDGPQLWYRIVPPSGEYRWIHRDQVVIDNEPQTAHTDTPANNDSPESTGPADETTASSASKHREQTLTDALRQDGLIALLSFRGRNRSSLVTPSTAPSVVPVNASDPTPQPVQQASLQQQASVQQASLQQATVQQAAQQRSGWQGQLRDRMPIGAATSTANPSIALADKDSAERVAEIQARVEGANVDQLAVVLSSLMAREASAAQTLPIVGAARRLASGSPDSIDRANKLAERAEQYARLAMRREATKLAGQSIGASMSSAQATIPAVRPNLSGVARTQSSGVSVSGYLAPVYSVRTGSPPFALTDSLGRTVAYVTPSPGFNMRTYVNSNVTVRGRQSFVAGLNRPVVFADSAVQKPQ